VEGLLLTVDGLQRDSAYITANATDTFHGYWETSPAYALQLPLTGGGVGMAVGSGVGCGVGRAVGSGVGSGVAIGARLSATG